MSTLLPPRRFQVIGPIVRWLHACVFAPTKTMAALALLVPLTAVSCGRPDTAPPVEMTRVTSQALTSQATASSISMNFNGAPIAAGSTIWFNSVVDLGSPPKALAHIVVSGGYITFNANKVGYNLPVPDGVLTIDPSATHATSTFDATGKWETIVPPQAAGKAFLTGLAYLVPVDLPGDIHSVTWHASFTTDTSGLCFQWQWGAAVESRFGHSHQESKVKASDDGRYSDNSDPAGTCEGFRDYVLPGGGGEGGGGEDYRGGHSDSRSVCPSLDKCQDLVTCAAPLACQTQGVCQAATGTCSTPSAPNGSACTIANAKASCQSGACALTACNAGYANCNGTLADGCETPNTTTSNCGTCGNACASGANSTAACASGACALNCAAGFSNCDGNAANGCELPTSADSSNCGGCGVVCQNHDTCAASSCGTSSCQAGYADCDKNPANGCEVTLATNVSSCGQCGNACSFPSAGASCSGGACVMGACAAGHLNCDGLASDGCEVDETADVNNCGGCGQVCSLPNATPTCSAGACAVSACNSGSADCDHKAADGCEVNTLGDIANCGGCGTVCAAAANASGTCTAGACGIACSAGFASCDGNSANGCETPVSADPSNCGGCGVTCANDEGCVAGVCTTAVCQTGYADCDKSSADGCEVTLGTDSSNCGQCGSKCAFANAPASCSGGTCVMGACSAGYADCDNNPTNGCEVSTATDALNCGSCGGVCSLPNATAACAASACAVAVCNGGYANCDGNPANGCEITTTSDVNNCGACGNLCPGGANGQATCVQGSCGIVCAAGFADCDGNATNGCEVQTTSDVLNCGTCGTTCRNEETCQSGACSATVCQAGFANCDGNDANGCEVNASIDLNNCGGCGIVCAFRNARAACSSGVCAIATCSAGFANCDGNSVNGCEVATTTDSNNCGSCGAACLNQETCQASACSAAVCQSGFANCDGNAANGCEITTTSDVNNCGVCGNACAFANAGALCANGGCAMGPCAQGFMDCDGNPANGCEVNAQADGSNCGSCGVTCTNHDTCQSGACTSLVCQPGYADCNGVPADGCETSTQTDPSNCNACGNLCSYANAGGQCAAGACAMGACNLGYADCDGRAASGCEVNTTADVNNCGGCGTLCSLPNAAPACVGGSCEVSACNSNYADCNGVTADGCEVNVAGGDPNNCGACGRVCQADPNGTATCGVNGSGICGVHCDPGFTLSGGVCLLPSDYPSTGSDGAFAPTSDVVLAPGVHNFTTITIPAGVTVTTRGVGVLDLRATGDVTIAGTVDVSGGAGGNPGPSIGCGTPGAFGSGGATGAPVAGVTLVNRPPISSTGGGGAPGGADPASAAGVFAPVYNIQASNGGGTGGIWDWGGGGGGGYAGGGAGGCNCGTTGGSGGSYGGAVGGAGGVSTQAGRGGNAPGPYAGIAGSTSTTCSGASPSAGAGGGGSIGAPAAADLAVAQTFQTGSAGGGGGSPCSCLASGGGGGGGGGGALRIATVGWLKVTGNLLANGGSGGSTQTPGNGGGGGGSGGVVFLYAPNMFVSGKVEAVGGGGGLSSCNVDGGGGGLGRIRISVASEFCQLGGYFNPPLANGCGANAAGLTFVTAYPN